MQGTYTIILNCQQRIRVRFGKLGCATLDVGHYLYTGSALGKGAVSLEGRLSRHARRSKKVRWHADFLTSRKECKFVDAVYLGSSKYLECKINRAIWREMRVKAILQRLGASDCHCEGHLVRVVDRSDDDDLMDRIRRVYSRFGEPHLYRDSSR